MYEIGRRRIGVRWTSGGLDAELRAIAGTALGVQEAPPNLSIVLGDSEGRTRSKHQLHVQGQLLSAVAGDGGLVRAVIRALGALAAEPPSGTFPLNACLVVEPGGSAVAVDWRLTAELQQLEPLLRRRGRLLLRLPLLHVWPDRRAAWLPDAPAAVGVSVSDLDARWPLEPGDDGLKAGEVPIHRFVFPGPPTLESPAEKVAAIVPTLRDPSNRVGRGDVARLATLTADLAVDAMLMGDRSRLARLLGL